MFKVCARTVLALGAELISSDIVALYELIKNAFDAKSPSGAEIRFEIAIRRNDYLKFQRRALEEVSDINRVKVDLYKVLNKYAQKDSIERIQAAINQVTEAEAFVEILDTMYARENRIIVSDTGTGMSEHDIVSNYLTIGTGSRKREIDAALSDHSYREKPTPYLGEKGIGRLSAMRLGDTLKVETAKKNDAHLNILSIDWSEFDTVDATLDKISITPTRGGLKPDPNWSGTRLIIGGLAADWTHDRVKNLCRDDFSRLRDPFLDTKRRPKIAVFWNGTRKTIPRMDRHLLEHAHAAVRGQYIITKSGPELRCTLEALDLGFDHPIRKRNRVFQVPDLRGFISEESRNIASLTLTDLGEFKFEAYWFNRKRLKEIDGIGNQKQVRDLQSRWSGILLFRDGFRVLPYGEKEDDWLDFDRKALGSKGYLLNRAQFVGRVAISRLGSPKLVDQTNRQGLRVCPEERAFVDLLNHVIQKELRFFLKDTQELYEAPLEVIAEDKTRISELLDRVDASLNKIGSHAPDFVETVNELKDIVVEFRQYSLQVQSRITEVENKNQLMVQMAGVGLLVEVVAHELARSAENALLVLESLLRKDVPDQIRSLFRALQSEMTAVNKRLRILDPLSVSGRQRKEKFVLDNLIQDILSSHEQQFKRHSIVPTLTMHDKGVRIYAVKGMIVQIIENLISNSLYWLDLRRHDEPEFKPQIRISVEANPLTVTYQDNGSGIAQQNQEMVFQLFFSLKEKSKRRGLGLFIARECAEYHGGSLQLDGEVNPETGRLHRFILELPSGVTVS